MTIKKKKRETTDEMYRANKNYIEIKSKGLDSRQLRLLKTFNKLMAHVFTTTNEKEYFESSSEVLRLCASMIQQSNFPEGAIDSIDYAEQVLEFSMDTLEEHVNRLNIITFDN